MILRVPVLFGPSTNLSESPVTVLAKDVIATDKPKMVSPRPPTPPLSLSPLMNLHHDSSLHLTL